VGKTSVTQLVRAGLDLAAREGDGAAHGSVRSFNNHIGVPLTLARMPRDARRAIFEIGMNHAGEIRPLTRLVAPRAAAITNVEAVHVENFADGEAGVMRAKAEIFEGLGPQGTAILNGDSLWFEDLKRIALGRGAKVRVFGRAEGADAHLMGFSATDVGAAIEARIDGGPISFSIRQSAAHWGPMSLCALLMMRALDVDLSIGLAALSAFEPLNGRGAERGVELPGGRLTVIDESYNASPVSMRAALEALGARKVVGRRVAALTDMLELGPESPARHAELAQIIEAANIDQVFCAGPLMRSLWDALPPGRRGGWAPLASDLAAALAADVRPGDAVMAKGSNASGARTFVDALTALGAPETNAP
jgi:UDP-N-acetylmuramoyl-tripeptide--D-alanyl-D-alanine ligase